MKTHAVENTLSIGAAGSDSVFGYGINADVLGTAICLGLLLSLGILGMMAGSAPVPALDWSPEVMTSWNAGA